MSTSHESIIMLPIPGNNNNAEIPTDNSNNNDSDIPTDNSNFDIQNISLKIIFKCTLYFGLCLLLFSVCIYISSRYCIGLNMEYPKLAYFLLTTTGIMSLISIFCTIGIKYWLKFFNPNLKIGAIYIILPIHAILFILNLLLVFFFSQKLIREI